MHTDTAAGRKQELLMRSARERVELLDTLAAARQSVTAGVGVACSSVKGVARKAGVFSAVSAATAIGVRLLGALLFRKKTKNTAGSLLAGWLFGVARNVLVAAAVPVVKEYAAKRLVQAVVPSPQPAAPAGVAEPYRVRESSSFFSVFSPKRFIANLLKM